MNDTMTKRIGIEVFVPLGNGQYATLTKIINGCVDEITSSDRVLAVRFCGMDDQDLPIPGLKSGFVHRYEYAGDDA